MKTSPKSLLLLSNQQREYLQNALNKNLSAILQQRIKIMLLADQGVSIEEIVRQLGCAQSTAEYWSRITHQGLISQWQDKPIGRPRKVDAHYIAKLQELLQNPPSKYGYPFRRWTVDWIIKHLAQELGVVVSNRNLKRLMKELGLSTCPTSLNRRNTSGRVQITDILAPPDHCNKFKFFLSFRLQ